MATWGVPRLKTVFKKGKPSSKSKKTKIRIPQPVDRPLQLHARDLVNRELLRAEDRPTVHKRASVLGAKSTANPNEFRAVPLQEIRGTLPERIVYKYLRDKMYMTVGIDFTFQTSMAGGRMFLGGIVADFVLPLLRMVIQVQGSTHRGYLRQKKDEEQAATLADFGYTVYEIDDIVIYNEGEFEQRMGRIFNMWGSSTAGDDA